MHPLFEPILGHLFDLVYHLISRLFYLSQFLLWLTNAIGLVFVFLLSRQNCPIAALALLKVLIIPHCSDPIAVFHTVNVISVVCYFHSEIYMQSSPSPRSFWRLCFSYQHHLNGVYEYLNIMFVLCRAIYGSKKSLVPVSSLSILHFLC